MHPPRFHLAFRSYSACHVVALAMMGLALGLIVATLVAAPFGLGGVQ